MEWYKVCQECNIGFSPEMLQEYRNKYPFLEWAAPHKDNGDFEGETAAGMNDSDGTVAHYIWRNGKWWAYEISREDQMRCTCKESK